MKTRLAAALAAAALTLTACAGDDLEAEGTDESSAPATGGGAVTIGTQAFDEALLVTALYQGVLEDAGYDVTVNAVDTRDVYVGEMPGSVDLAPEYVGGIADFLNATENGPDAEPITTSDTQETIDAATPLLEAKGLVLLEPSEATSQNAYFVTQDYADELGATALSDLEGESVVLAAAPDCEGRADCEGGLTDVYGIDVTELLPLGFASPQTYEAVLSGEAQVGQTGTLDGTLDEQGLVLLEDDRGIQPAQNLVPLVSEEFLAENEGVEDLLNGLMAELDNEVLADLIARVTVDREQPDAVADEFLAEVGLVS